MEVSSEVSLEVSLDSIIGLDINNLNSRDLWEVTKVINKDNHLPKDNSMGFLPKDIICLLKDSKGMEAFRDLLKELLLELLIPRIPKDLQLKMMMISILRLFKVL